MSNELSWAVHSNSFWYVSAKNQQNLMASGKRYHRKKGSIIVADNVVHVTASSFLG